MKRSRYSPEQITFALHQAESGVPATEVCRVGDRRAGVLPQEEAGRRG